MLLAMDAGNTQIVCGCMEEDRLRKSFRLPTRPGRTREETLAELRQGLKTWGLSPADFRGAVERTPKTGPASA